MDLSCPLETHVLEARIVAMGKVTETRGKDHYNTVRIPLHMAVKHGSL